MKMLPLLFLAIFTCISESFPQTFPRNQVIDAGEYFLDTDPGEGYGIPMTGQFGLSSVNTVLNIALQNGSEVHIRLRSSNGKWSPARGIRYKYKELINAQYYIKYSGGSQTQYQNMLVSNEPLNSPFFLGTSNNIPSLTENDTVFVRFQSDDYFWSQWSKVSGLIVGIADKNNFPNEFKLYSAYPNPFNPVTTIRYEIPKFSEVKLEVYDVLGRKVLTLVDDKKEAGSYKIEFNMGNFSSGVYFYRIQSGSFTKTKKIILLQ